MPAIDIEEARVALADLIERAAAGEEIVLSIAGHPVARLVPTRPAATRARALGIDRGLFAISADFDAPLPSDLVDDFENSRASSAVP